MAYIVWPLLCFLFPLSSLAGPLYTASLSPSVLAGIARCARSCVKEFVAREFSSSGCQQDSACFCKSDSTSGYTLGEGAFGCLKSHCSESSATEQYSVYQICENIPDAKPRTHGTWTATLPEKFSSTSTPTTHRRTLSSCSFRSPKTGSPTPSTTSRSSSKFTSTVCETQSSTLSSKMSTLPSAIATASPSTSTIVAAAPKPGLAKSQIAGIAIGGVACIAAAIGLLFFVFCIRRRRSNKKRLSGSSFGGDKIIHSNPVSPVPFPPRNGDSEPVQYISPRSVPTRDSDSEQARQMAPPPIERQYGFITPERKSLSATILGRRGLHPEEIGIALVPETGERLAVDEPPLSAASYRTTSKLLPDKPTYQSLDKPSYSLWPAPSRPQNPRSPVSPITSPLPGEAGIGQKGPMPLSRPSPRLGNSPDTNPLQLQRGFSPMHASASDPFLDKNPGSQALTYTSPRRQRLRLEMPSSNRPDPEILQQGQWTQSLDDLRKPVAARHGSSARELNRQKAVASISPNDYTGRAHFQPLLDRPPHVRREGQRTKGTNRSGPSTARYSSASDTNFEDTDDEEEIPPMPTSHHFLSPGDVAPSGVRGSATSQQFGQQLTPTSPTPNPPRRTQLVPPPLSLQNLSASKGMQKRKPLPGVPELPDTPAIASGQERRENSPAIPRNNTKAANDVRNTAKWQILVSPGLKGIDGPSTPPPQVGNTGGSATPSKEVAARKSASPPRRN